jgi:hypothetical protein
VIPGVGKNLLTWRVVFTLPPILLAVFLSSLATIEAANGRMRYRRFVTWRNLDQDEIQRSGKSSVLIGDIGYLQLSHYLVPWGKLYFVLDRGTFMRIFVPRDYGLIKSSSKAVVDPGPDDAHDAIRTRVPLNVQGLVCALAGGIFSAGLRLMPTPPVLLYCLGYMALSKHTLQAISCRSCKLLTPLLA